MSKVAPSIKSEFYQKIKSTFKQVNGENAASLNIFLGGEEIVSLQNACEPEALFPFWSAAKAFWAFILLKIMEAKGLNLDMKVAEIYEIFQKEGKEKLSFRDILNHRAGLFDISKLKSGRSIKTLADFEQALQEKKPEFLACGSAYHAITYFFLIDLLCRKISGKSLDEKLIDFCHQNKIDGYFPAPPPNVRHRLQNQIIGKIPAAAFEFYQCLQDKNSPSARAFNCLDAINPNRAIDENRLNGKFPNQCHFTDTRSVSAFYQKIIAEIKKSKFLRDAIAINKNPTSTSHDGILLAPVSFHSGFMRGFLSEVKISPLGHPGAGGQLAFCVPEYDASFCYLSSEFRFGVMPDKRSRKLAKLFLDYLS